MREPEGFGSTSRLCRGGSSISVSSVAPDVAASRRVGIPSRCSGRVRAARTTTTIKRALRASTDAAHELGVFGVPTIAVAGELFWGDDRLEDAAGQRAERGLELR